MYDLIDECGEEVQGLGYETFKQGKFSLCIGKIEVNTPLKAKQSGFEMGSYYIYSCPLMHAYKEECEDYLVFEMTKCLRALLRKHNLNKKSRVLIVGLGNPQILADCLGGKVLDNIDLQKRKLNIFKFAPNIFYNTGINSFDVVQMLSIWLDIDCVIIIDALGTNSTSRLTTSVQINDAGMTPASAVNNSGHKLSKDTLGVPCLSIGVPTMLLAGKVSKNLPEELILTPKDIHQELDFLAKIISKAIMSSI